MFRSGGCKRSKSGTRIYFADSCPNQNRCREQSNYSTISSGGEFAMGLRPPAIRGSRPAVRRLGIGRETIVVDKSDAAEAKPEPDLFLECQKRLGVAPAECYVVGDATWDLLAAQRAGMLALAVLSGGYSDYEMIEAGAHRVFDNAKHLHDHLDELGLTADSDG